DVAVDPTDWRRVFVLDENGHIWFSADGGVTDTSKWQWADLTGNLGNSIGASNLRKILYDGVAHTLLAGADGGLYAAVNPTTEFSAADTLTRISPTQFSVAGDQRQKISVGQRVNFELGANGADRAVANIKSISF